MPARPDSPRLPGSSWWAASQNRLSGPRPPRVIPDAGGDDAALPRDATHLGQPGDGIGHEVDDELRERRVELAVRETAAPPPTPAGRRRPGFRSRDRCDERLGRIDRRDRRGAEARDELGGERARAASDVEDALTAADAGEVCEERRELRPSTGP